MQALLARWNNLRARSRAFVFAGALVVLAVAGVVAAFERDTRVVLFPAALHADQVAEVVDRLAQWNVPFVAGTDNVRVDPARRNELLLQLALAGVPHPHLETASEALAKAGPLTPQSVLDAQVTAGIAGDLAAGLRTLAGVRDAAVIIAPGVADAYAGDDAHAASASVRLSLQPGATLTRDVSAGVRAFVASAVPGLEAGRVTILDDRGLAFAGAETVDGDGGESAALQASLQSALDLALGAGATIVRVRVAYDPRSRDVHAVVRKPVGSRAIGTTTADEHYASASKRYTKINSSVDAGSVTEDDRVETPAGRVERISVAVAVDAGRRLDLDTIRSLARATLGLVSSRGDQLSVEAVAFPHGARAATPSRFASMLGFAAALVAPVSFAATLIALAWFGARPAARALELLAAAALRQRSAATPTVLPATVRGRLANEPPHTAAAIISALPAATASAVLELYPLAEREAIVRRMSRGSAPVVPDYETLVRRG